MSTETLTEVTVEKPVSSTILQVQKDFDTLFSGLDEASRKATLKTIEYIMQLGALTSTNISRWNILSVFGSGEKNQLVTDKNEINKRFFSCVTAKAEGKEADLNKVDDYPELIEIINRQAETKRKAVETAALDKLKRVKIDLDAANQNVTKYLGTMFKLNQELKSVQGVDYTTVMKEELGKVLNDSAWVNPVYADGYLWLNTKNNVVCTYKNKAANVDLEVNFGQLAVKIDVNTLSMWVTPFKNNIGYDRCSAKYYHPHVDYEGHICWGNALNQVSEWARQGKIADTLKMLYSLLFTYNDGNPYVHLQDFKEHQKSKYGRCNDRLMHPGKRKKKEATAEGVPVGEWVDTNHVFVQGEEVEFELSRAGSYPRWDHRTETGGTGEWVRGVVRTSTDYTIRVDYARAGYSDSWDWPGRVNDRYDADQWSRPGYLRHVRPSVIVSSPTDTRPFVVGDMVEYEMSSMNPNAPRYSYATDNGGNGHWETGRVANIYGSEVEVRRSSGALWIFKIEGNVRSLPGFLRHSSEPTPF